MKFNTKISMFTIVAIIIFLIIPLLFSCNSKQNEMVNKNPVPPDVKKIPKELVKHGDKRIDNYFWLNNREDSAVIAYLNAENEYTNKVLGHTKAFQEKLYNEMVGRIKKTDESVPYFKNGYYYYSRTEGDAEYPLYCRKKGSLDAEEEIMLNVPEMAKNHSFYAIGTFKVSKDNKLLAYSEDTVSRRLYTIKIKNLETGETYPEAIVNTSGGITWANDNNTIFYTIKDTQTLLPYKVFKHKLGDDSANDELIYEEKDNTFYTFSYKTKSDKYIMIASRSTMTTEYRFIDADKPDSEFKIIQPRTRGLEYQVDHFGDYFYIRTNADSATNFKIVKTPVDKTEKENWEDVIPHRSDVFAGGFEIFKDYFVLQERIEGLIQMRIRKWDDGSEHYLDFGEATYDAWISVNPEFDTNLFRYGYTSLTTPQSTYDYNMETKEKTLKKQREVLGEFSPDNYHAERIWATAGDGAKVPISLVYRKDMRNQQEGNPIWIKAYGSYGNNSDPYFSTVNLSLLDRGFIFAIAHVRGGQEMGRKWYQDGKLLKKKNTFTDFNACTEFLVKEKYAHPDKVFAWGGSAGGLLMGAIVNMKPQLYKGVIAAVPFVDVVTTMLDESIPLTTGEYDEWGNPNEKKYYDYMLSYSPYDNVKAQNYPAMLVTTGLHDSQVQYWEPAKWVAKLRDMKTDNNMLLLKTNMEFGHGGASGRFERLKEKALEFAFVFDLAGIKQ